MPLPDADDPKTSNLYAQLRTSQLDSVSQDNFDKVKDPVFFNAAFEDEARRLKLWGEISGKLSASGPMPGTGRLVKHEQTTNDVQTVFQPDPGEVYVLMGADASAFGTGQNGATLSLSDGTNTMVIADSSSAGDMNDHGFRGGTYVDNVLYLTFQPNNISSGTATLEVALIRVR
jgi:hypothetical protein